MSADDVFPLPRDRNGKVIRFGDTVEVNAHQIRVNSIRLYADGTAQVASLLAAYDVEDCVVVKAASEVAS